MKIYTKTGDDGRTGLLGGQRVTKDHVRIEAYGEVDELNSVLGWCRALGLPEPLEAIVERVQHELFSAGAELARPEPRDAGPEIEDRHVAALESEIDRLDDGLPSLTQFILPGGSRPAATLHVARAVCRRVERRVTSLSREPSARVSPRLIRYFNRLGDLLFVMARHANQATGATDTPWRRDG